MTLEDLNSTCWICMDECLEDPGNIDHFKPCACPRLCHKACLARWCLQQAGKSEETTCRFCYSTLQDWRSNIKPLTDLKHVVPTMGINFNGITHIVNVEPGEAGREKFIAEVRRRLNLRPDQLFDVMFECRLPSSDERLDLNGFTAYDAAVYCATLRAAERVQAASSLLSSSSL